MLYSNSFLHVIVKPTKLQLAPQRLLTTYVHTNTTTDLNSGTGVIDISDCLPIFCIIDITVNHSRNTIQLRDYTHFSQELYRDDILTIDWNAIISENTKYIIISDLTNSITGAVKVVIDKHVPINS